MIQLNANFFSREKISTKYKKTSIKCWRKLITSIKNLRFVKSFVNSFSRQTLFRTRMTILRIFWTLKLFVNWNDESMIISTTFWTNLTNYASIEINIWSFQRIFNNSSKRTKIRSKIYLISTILSKKIAINLKKSKKKKKTN